MKEQKKKKDMINNMKIGKKKKRKDQISQKIKSLKSSKEVKKYGMSFMINKKLIGNKNNLLILLNGKLEPKIVN